MSRINKLDRAFKLSGVREYCMELMLRGDTTPKEEEILLEILKVSGMVTKNNEGEDNEH